LALFPQIGGTPMMIRRNPRARWRNGCCVAVSTNVQNRHTTVTVDCQRAQSRADKGKKKAHGHDKRHISCPFTRALVRLPPNRP
jgi:hypothetical protein